LTGSAVKYAIRLLAYRGRSEQELRDRLAQKGFGEDIISGAIRELKQAGFIDDLAFAGQMRRYAIEQKLLGTEGVRRFLLRKGIRRETVDAVIGFDEEAEFANILKLAEKKLRGSGLSPDPASMKRLWAFLVRRGYAPHVIRKALREYRAFEEESE